MTQTPFFLFEEKIMKPIMRGVAKGKGLSSLLTASRSFARRPSTWIGLLVSMGCLAAVELTPNIPSIFNAAESEFQAQTHFLVFTGSDTAGENATTAKAYYKAIDPNNTKPTFEDWLVKAGSHQ